MESLSCMKEALRYHKHRSVHDHVFHIFQILLGKKIDNLFREKNAEFFLHAN